jgi:hypothetical protein
MWEKMVGTHEKALWVRLASRLPYRERLLTFAGLEAAGIMLLFVPQDSLHTKFAVLLP